MPKRRRRHITTGRSSSIFNNAGFGSTISVRDSSHQFVVCFPVQFYPSARRSNRRLELSKRSASTCAGHARSRRNAHRFPNPIDARSSVARHPAVLRGPFICWKPDFREPWTLNEIAAHVGISRAHLAKFISARHRDSTAQIFK